MSVAAMIAGPLIGLVVVLVIYLLGIAVSIKCCRTDEAFREAALSSRIPHRILDPISSSDLDVYIISRTRPEEYYNLNIPRPTLIAQQSSRNTRDTVAAGPAPAYENPPSYEDCVPEGIV
ncbi:unnamed protein product [Orchesella dallaii]|uniref:Uncharacterized protein n=1 Tax=Orchesella dallaii TaxID=48710 RepID=A0ABP1RDE5_9HEXA